MNIKRHVVIDGEVLFYQQKAPYVASGVSIKGALEYDPQTDRVRCHECGTWFKDLAHHVTVHKLTVEEYKKRHGFGKKAALISEGLRQQRLTVGIRHSADVRERFRPALEQRLRNWPKHDPNRNVRPWSEEKKNKHGSCQAQLLQRLKSLTTNLGHSPGVKELNSAGIRPSTLCAAFNVYTIADVYSLLRMEPRREYSARKQYSPVMLVELLRDFYGKHHRIPTVSDFYRGIIPHAEIYRRTFGSIENAFFEAGLLGVYEKQKQGQIQNGVAEIEPSKRFKPWWRPESPPILPGTMPYIRPSLRKAANND